MIAEGLDTKFFFSVIAFGQRLEFESIEGVLGGEGHGP